MDEQGKVEDVIYYHNGEGDFWFLGKLMKLIVLLLLSAANGALAALVLIVILSFFMEDQIWVFRISWILFSILIFYLILKSERKSKTSYKIYKDRLEFFNERYPLEKDIIDLDEIDQVRYEDDFGKSYSSDVSHQSWIYCYFKNGYKSKSINIKKDRLKLQIGRDRETENRVIKILLFFQEKKKQVYISTRSGKIKTALNLKNWTDPGIHPSVRL